jgi:hypothetical protein
MDVFPWEGVAKFFGKSMNPITFLFPTPQVFLGFHVHQIVTNVIYPHIYFIPNLAQRWLIMQIPNVFAFYIFIIEIVFMF